MPIVPTDPLKLIYLDREFMASLYESETGQSPATSLSTSETIHASAKLPIFSGGASAVETRTYSMSTLGMLQNVARRLEQFPVLEDVQLKDDQASVYLWASGVLTINVLKRRRSERNAATGKKETVTVAEVPYYALDGATERFALIPTEDYFQSGFRGLRELHDSVLGPIDLPVTVLLRVVSARTHFKQWISIPQLIYEE